MRFGRELPGVIGIEIPHAPHFNWVNPCLFNLIVVKQVATDLIPIRLFCIDGIVSTAHFFVKLLL